ncbi:MAG: hypothetical protein IKO65_09545 [Victivallales bacterium]|nr:hypothetical protein [Victivallales bacterium]
MDFLAKHFEKFILAVCLVCLLWSIKSVSDHEALDVEKTAQTINSMTVEKVAKGTQLVERIDAESLEQLDDMLNNQQLKLNLLSNGNRNGTGLFDGGQFIICKNPKCGYALRFDEATCPFCGTAQEVVGPDPLPTDDLDKDGIPDLAEKSNPVLNYRYPYDSMADYDGDGFLNIEEYRAGTDLEDATSRPPLVYLLRRVGAAEHAKLPVVLKRVKTFGDTNTAAWKANVSIQDSPRAVDLKAGDEIKGTSYTLLSIPNANSIVIKDAGGTEYTLSLNQDGHEKEFSVEFIYLTSHVRGRRPAVKDAAQMSTPAITDEDYEKMLTAQRNNTMGGGMPMGGMPMGGGMRQGNMGMGADGGNTNNMNSNEQPLRFRLHVGDNFVLQKIFTLSDTDAATHPEAVGLFTEYYTVLDVQPAKAEGEQDIVRVQQLAGENGNRVGAPIEIPILDNSPMPRIPSPASKDYFFTPVGGTGMGGMMGGMGMMP